MNKSFFSLIVAGALGVGFSAQAAGLNAELIMRGGKSWQGAVTARDGEWVSFSPGTGTRPIRIGANTIKELIFEVRIDQTRLKEMNENREYARIIDALTRTLKPFEEYSDIPSNLTVYNSLLMEIYYKTGDFDNTLTIAEKIAADDRDEKLQAKARVYMALALIDAGKSADAEKLLAEYGWDQNLDDDSDPAQLYIAAKLLSGKKEYPAAMEMVAKIIAFNSQNPQWMRPAELLCAEIYIELGATNPIMYDSAEEVIRQISMLYPNSNEDDLARKLKIRLDQLRAEQ